MSVGQFLGGDILCNHCRFILATVYKEKPATDSGQKITRLVLAESSCQQPRSPLPASAKRFKREVRAMRRSKDFWKTSRHQQKQVPTLARTRPFKKPPRRTKALSLHIKYCRRLVSLGEEES